MTVNLENLTIRFTETSELLSVTQHKISEATLQIEDYRLEIDNCNNEIVKLKEKEALLNVVEE